MLQKIITVNFMPMKHIVKQTPCASIIITQKKYKCHSKLLFETGLAIILGE